MVKRGRLGLLNSIRERPSEIEDRAILGSWEGDPLGGTKSSQIVALVDRHSRFWMLVNVPGKAQALRSYPRLDRVG